MLLIGVNRSPYTRRVAITLAAYGVAYEQRCLSGFGNRDEVRRHNPLGRIPALVLDDGETLIDSGAIVDLLDERYGGECPDAGGRRGPAGGAEGRGDHDGRLRQGPAGGLPPQSHAGRQAAPAVDGRLHGADEDAHLRQSRRWSIRPRRT